MRKGFYPVIAGVLIALLLLATIFEPWIDAASPLIRAVLLGAVVLIVLGAVVLALWDTEVIGRKG